MMDWARKVNNILRTVYGDSSEENTKFCSQQFEGDEKRVIEVIAFSTGLLRDCVRKLKRAISVNSFSRDCFVATWFNPSMEEVYQYGIYKSLKELGFNPIRVDKVEHNDRINHVILDDQDSLWQILLGIVLAFIMNQDFLLVLGCLLFILVGVIFL